MYNNLVLAMIEIHGLKKIIGLHTALDIPDLVVASGEIVALVGPTGSGKETLFELLTRRVRPSAGTVRLAGVDPSDRETLGHKAGFLFLEDGLYLTCSPLANLSLHCQLHGLPLGRAREVLAQVSLADQADTNPKNLSSGQLRRLAFGRAILHQPQVLLLFEPFARCDEDTILLIAGLLRQLAEKGMAVLILADDDAYLEGLCSAIYPLNQGRLGDPAQSAREQPAVLSFKIPVRLEEKVLLVNPGEVLYVEAAGGRACLHTLEACLETQFTLGELEERLSRSGFFRAHRAYLVNLQHVKEVIPYTRNSFSLRLDDAAGTKIPLSKAAAGELRVLLGY